VLGVDIAPQPNYPFEFIQDDALDFLDMGKADYEPGFDAIHASPPCQHHANVTRWGHQYARPRESYPELIGPIRERLEATGLPYVIENVRTRALRHPTMLCGTWFGLQVIRHRYFECSVALPWFSTPCQHVGFVPFDHGGAMPETVFRDAMGCEWMTKLEARQAIPPAYTEWIGRHLLAHLCAAERAPDLPSCPGPRPLG
jgi:hypothetical protein